jgi:hypothetical protein
LPPRAHLVCLLLIAGCAPIRAGSPEDVDHLREICAGPVPPASRLEIVELSPAAGSAVNRDSVIRAKLSYAFPGSCAGDCILVGRFISTQGGSFLSNFDRHIARPQVARGTETLEIHLRPHFDDPKLARPVRLHFVIQNLRGGGILAESEPVSYGPGQPQGPALTVRSLDPAPDERLTQATVIDALVAYDIPAFASAKYVIRTQLAGLKGGETILPQWPGATAPVTAATGRAVLHLPLARLLDTPGTRRPLELSFVVVKVEGNSVWRLEETRPVSYDFCKVIGTPPPEHP